MTFPKTQETMMSMFTRHGNNNNKNNNDNKDDYVLFKSVSVLSMNSQK